MQENDVSALQSRFEGATGYSVAIQQPFIKSSAVLKGSRFAANLTFTMILLEGSLVSTAFSALAGLLSHTLHFMRGEHSL